jgi:hypothetical protein
MRYLLFSARSVLGFSAAAGILLLGFRADAASVVVLKYNVLRESLSVPELARFAETGKVCNTNLTQS